MTTAAKVLQDQDEFKFPDAFVRQVRERLERKAQQETRMQQQAETLELKRAGTVIEREKLQLMREANQLMREQNALIASLLQRMVEDRKA